MKEAVIVSTARTGLAKSVRGGFNKTHGAVMGGHAVKHAIARGRHRSRRSRRRLYGLRLARRRHRQQYRARMRDLGRLPGDDRRRHHQPLLLLRPQAIAMAAQQIMTDGTDIAIGSGVESISLVQMGGMNLKNFTEEHLLQVKPALWMTHDRDRRDRGRALWHQPRAPGRICAGKPAAHRRGPGRAANSRTRSCR